MTLVVLDPRTGTRVMIVVSDKPVVRQAEPAKVVQHPRSARS
jgi:hypothetical protein